MTHTAAAYFLQEYMFHVTVGVCDLIITIFTSLIITTLYRDGREGLNTI